MAQHDCGVPFGGCFGATGNHVAGTHVRGYKTHATYDEASRCQKRWLRRENDRRAMSGEPILLGSKPQRMKRGKNLEGKGDRWMAPAFRG